MPSTDWSIGVDQGKNRDKNAPEILIGQSCQIFGELEASGRTVIAGKVSGQIRGDMDLSVAGTAVLNASVEASSVEVFGEVKGDISCTRQIRLCSGARVEGDITAPEVVIEEGVRFKGRCSMGEASGSIEEPRVEKEIAEEAVEKAAEKLSSQEELIADTSSEMKGQSVKIRNLEV